MRSECVAPQSPAALHRDTHTHLMLPGQAAIGRHVSNPELGVIPRHIWVLPADPRQPAVSGLRLQQHGLAGGAEQTAAVTTRQGNRLQGFGSGTGSRVWVGSTQQACFGQQHGSPHLEPSGLVRGQA